MQQPQREGFVVFLWQILSPESPDSAQFKRGISMLQMFSRFVTVGLNVLHVIFQTCMKQLYLRFLCMCFISTKSKRNETNRWQLM